MKDQPFGPLGTLKVLLRKADAKTLHELKDASAGQVDHEENSASMKLANVKNQQRRLKGLKRQRMGNRYNNLKKMFGNVQLE